MGIEISDFLKKEQEGKIRLDFLGQVPCPIKPKFKEAFANMAKEHYKKTKKEFFTYIPISCPHDMEREKSLSNILSAESIDEIPDIAVTFGIGDYCYPKIIKNYISKGYFKKVIDLDKCEMLKGIDFSDPYNGYNVLCTFPTVIMIDKKKIGDLPIPKKIMDLLDPIYKDSIAISGGHGRVSLLFPMHVYKEYGEEGLKKLDNNICNILHGSKMAKIAGTNNSEGAPIYVMSWFFAKACTNYDNTEIIWPEDGALIDPLILMVKKDISEELNPILDFITSEKVSEIFADNYFPSTYPNIDNKLPENAKFQWIGWDYIVNNSLEEFDKMIQNKFSKYIK